MFLENARPPSGLGRGGGGLRCIAEHIPAGVVARRGVECWLGVAVLFLLSGCHTYEPRPLNPADVLAGIDRSFRAPRFEDPQDPDAPGVTLRQCARWMLAHGPGVREAVAQYQAVLARASTKTPLPNPTLQVGPEYGFGSDVTTNRVVPFGSLGITIPLSGRIGKQDELNRVRAEVARIDGVARHRELYLDLRRIYGELVLARQRTVSRRQLLEAAERSAASARRLVDAGQGTAIDVALFELEKGRAQAQLLEAQAFETDTTAALATIVGVHESLFEQLPGTALPDLPQLSLALDEAKSLLLDNHPELARLRARYEEAEAALRLEVAKQYPDIRIGPSVGGEAGERMTTLGLTLGIDLPVFDRNQQGIAEAEGRREEARTRYVSEATRALVELERALRSLGLAMERLLLLRGTVLPQARRSIDLARQSLAAGAGDALRLLDTERSYRRFLIQVIEAEVAARSAWTRLEHAVGKPLIRFPNEGADDTQAPEELRSERRENLEEPTK